jgi:hypothetical protein
VADNAARSVIVGRYVNPWDAYLACGRLNAEGIPAWVAYDQHVWADWPLSTALGGVRIMTILTQESEAQALLAAHDRGDFESCLTDEEREAATLHCPNCDSIDIETRRFGSLIPLLLFFFPFGAIFPVRRDRHHCCHCGRNWLY